MGSIKDRNIMGLKETEANNRKTRDLIKMEIPRDHFMQRWAQ